MSVSSQALKHPGPHWRPATSSFLIKLRPVLFKHEHGDSGAMAATGAATKAGSYRLALGRNETHIVESRSDLSGDFLQVEKTEIDPKTFNGRKVREEPTDRSRTSSKVEFDAAQLRIVRVFCAGAMTCEPREAVVPALVVDLRTGDVRWLTPSAGVNGNNHAPASGECLKIEFKGKPLPAHD